MRVLVTVGSRHGATREIGGWVADVLAEAGHAVDRLEPEEVAHVRGYDAVVLGSAVYAGGATGPVRDLVRRCRAELEQARLWVFWSGPVGEPLQPTGRPEAADRLLGGLSPRSVAVLPGRLDPGRLGPAERAVVRLMRVPAGDFRDVGEVTAWARGIADELAAAGPTVPSSTGLR